MTPRRAAKIAAAHLRIAAALATHRAAPDPATEARDARSLARRVSNPRK